MKIVMIELKEEQKQILEQTNEMLKSMMEFLSEQVKEEEDIVSPYTGEAFSLEEVCRVRGILDGLLTNRTWLVGRTE